VLSPLDAGDGQCAGTIHGHLELDAAAGTACAWACLPLPDVPDQSGHAWLLLGSPRSVPAAAFVSLGSLVNQVTLALRNSAVHQDLTVLASLDGLTGLANRASFNAALSGALDDESVPDTSVLFVDLDDFKDVNDVFGHRVGDQLLRVVAARLLRATRPEDLCARIGGDEFAVLLRGTTGTGAADVARRIVEAVAAPAHLEGAVVRIGASVGVATGARGVDLESLIHCADVAMYAAKANGKAQVQAFEPGLLQGALSQVTFERDLAAAVENGELVVHYQPVVSLPEGRCTAVEALVRWQHPQRDLLYPDAFIETAERMGAIGDIGAYVLRRACADTATWRDAYVSSPLAIHVNVSALQLDDEFTALVAACLEESGLPPEQLVLEFTETVVISSAAAIDRLNDLAASGVTIAMDDFGTGYSALTALRALPVHIVKIDRSFIAGSTTSREDRAVTEAIVGMATQLGLRTIAEGVERSDQQEYLESIGVKEAQGFFYLRPTPALEFGAWLGAHLAGAQVVEPATAVVIPFTPRHIA
jgi:diguanylate cyclase (GGDEF)-like protein